MTRPIVILESPYAGDIDRNIAYAKCALRDSINRGEAPLASHLLYPQVLDDADDAEREMGFRCLYAWYNIPEVVVVFYTDYGFSPGMLIALDHARKMGLLMEERQIANLQDK